MPGSFLTLASSIHDYLANPYYNIYSHLDIKNAYNVNKKQIPQVREDAPREILTFAGIYEEELLTKDCLERGKKVLGVSRCGP